MEVGGGRGFGRGRARDFRPASMAGGRAAEFLAEATQVWVLPKGGTSWVGPKVGCELIAGGEMWRVCL